MVENYSDLIDFKKIIRDYESQGVLNVILRGTNRIMKIRTWRLLPNARQVRKDTTLEAINWPTGKNQMSRIVTPLSKINEYTIAAGKPGKEAAPDYRGCINYKTREKTNNPNDMNPMILKNNNKINKNFTFEEMFESIEKLMRKDIFGLDLLGCLIFRNAFMLDHIKNKDNRWRYAPSNDIVSLIEKRIPIISGVPAGVFLHFLDLLAINEDVKVYTLGHTEFKEYGRVNTLLTFAHLIAVLLQRRSLAKFAGGFARPPSGMAPMPRNYKYVARIYPLLSAELFKDS